MPQSRVLVSGGRGFLGKQVCLAFLEAGYKVRSFSREKDDALVKLGVDYHRVNLSHSTPQDLRSLTDGCSVVVHTAAKAGVSGSWQDYYAPNVLGTQSLLEAAQISGVRVFAYTSSPSVVFSGENQTGKGEELPYAEKFFCHYPRSKKLAELSVLAAHKRDKMITFALRPHLIWGAGDPHFLPRLSKRYAEGKLRQVGRGENMVDCIHVKNAARAHLLAVQNALSSNPSVGGKAYFIGQEHPVNLWGFIRSLLEASGYNPQFAKVPFWLAYPMGWFLEWIFAKHSDGEPPMTRFLALQLARSHFYSHRRALRDFGYSPLISIEQGLEELRGGLSSFS